MAYASKDERTMLEASKCRERDLEPRQIGKFFPRKPGGKAKAQGKRAVEEKMRKTRREITTIISS